MLYEVITLVGVGNRLVDGLMGLLGLVTKNRTTRLATVLGMTALSVATAWLLLPKMEYLPQGNRNLVINILVPPPGLSYAERKEIGEHIFTEAKPYFGKGKDGIVITSYSIHYTKLYDPSYPPGRLV